MSAPEPTSAPIADGATDRGTRVAGKVAMVVGAGQTPGDTIGNGRATSLLLARHGARIIAVDRDLASAEQTAAMVGAEGGEATAVRADITSEDDQDRCTRHDEDGAGGAPGTAAAHAPTRTTGALLTGAATFVVAPEVERPRDVNRRAGEVACADP